MESVPKEPKESLSDMDLPTSSSDAPMAANGPVLMVKTKAALKQYPPYMSCRKAHKRSKHGKHCSKKKKKRKREAEVAAAPELKKIKVEPVTAMPEPKEEEPVKEAQEHTTGEASVAAAAKEAESQ